ncbi:MAG: sigma-54 dependent transcriptional regulator, partial [Desulfobacteraceae bacterium]
MDRPFEEIQILVVDDEKSIRRLAQKELASPRRRITTAATFREAQELLRQQAFDVVVLDMRLPDGDGLGLLLKIKETDSNVEVIMVTGYADIEGAVEAMKMGAYDFLAKPFNLDRLEILIERAFQRVSLERENRLLRHSQTVLGPRKLIGHSAEMEQVRFLITKVAPTLVPVLITGESGTGKNVVARSIHRLSPRSDHPLVTKNCGTLEKSLIRSELFGHRKGAFTGAHENRDGLLSVAHKGTLFLDEIGELSLEVQSALLRVLENQTYRRVGDKDERHVDIRFIFATNRCLTDEVQNGRFSQALFHRLNVFNINLPPLKDRKEDIPALVEYFLARLCPGGTRCRISQKAMQCLLGYSWPG